MTHEATHAAQQCNNNSIVSSIETLDEYKKKQNIPSNFSDNYKEVEAYYYQDQPNEVKKKLENLLLPVIILKLNETS